MPTIIHKNVGYSIKPCYYANVNKLTVVTWNIGFGAMGAEAEVKMDGGNRFIPSSRAHIKKNMRGIIEYVREHNADVFLLQEVSFGSLLNYWHNVEHKIRKALATFHIQFASNFKFPLWLRFLRNEHGLSTYVHHRHNMKHHATKRYSKSETYYRLFSRKDRFITTLITPEGSENPLAIINTHLSSFDRDGAIRKAQCAEVLAYAQELYAQGYAVVIGADWNMHMTPSIFSVSAIGKQHICDFPVELLPHEWHVHTCLGTPTVRAANGPYQKDISTTAVIDGFVCSPGISVESVRAIDLDFQYSDHQPVEITLVY